MTNLLSPRIDADACKVLPSRRSFLRDPLIAASVDGNNNYQSSSIPSARDFFESLCSAQPFIMLNLPNELLYAVATLVPDRHPVTGRVLESATVNLASLSCVSRRVRDIALSELYREVVITSEAKLCSLQHAPPHHLARIRYVALRLFKKFSTERDILFFSFKSRTLNISLDPEFLDAWRSWALIGPVSPVPGRQSIYVTLINVLARTPNLRSLRMCVRETDCPRNASKLAICRAANLPFGPALIDAIKISSHPNLSLPGLQTLEMDGFEDIAGLLQLVPNLKSLRACLSAGLSQRPNADLIHALHYVPSLKELFYCCESLRVQNTVVEVVRPVERGEGGEDDAEGEPEMPKVDPSVLRCVEVLGRLLPELERLDLATTWFRRSEVMEPSKNEMVNPEVCLFGRISRYL